MQAAGKLLLVIALGMVAVFASWAVSITTNRRLRALRDAADELATDRLPGVVDRLGRGEQVDVATAAPPLETGRDEIGQVGVAFNRMQETAVRVAVEQAELRRGVRDVFLSMARRSQALLHRQLGLLDAMERRATTPEALAELFRVDHLATRMRRNAENLIVLTGATAGRTWRKPVPMVDVLRAALAEVEDFTRVTVLPPASCALIGPAVGDVIHLLAELVENAVSFSPPQAPVRVGGALVGESFVIEVEDRGLGLSETQRDALNRQLRQPPDFALTSTAQLGLYVVSRLAQRHGVRVELTPSPYGGTTARVTVPGDLITVAPSILPAADRLDEDRNASRPVETRRTGRRDAASGPTPSVPATSAVAGLPMRRRSDPPPVGTAAVPEPRPAPVADAEAVPLPGMAGLDERPARHRAGPDDSPLWTDASAAGDR
jgi:signal transduction histidine kinase